MRKKHAEVMSEQPFILGEKSPGDEELIAFAEVETEAEDAAEIRGSSTEASAPGEDEGRNPADTEKDILKGPQFRKTSCILCLKNPTTGKISGFDSFEMLLEDEESVSLAENTARMFFPHGQGSSFNPFCA